MEKYKFNRQKLQRDSADRKVHYKLYKAGTRWLVAGMATLTFGISAFALPQEVKADTVATDGSNSNTTTIDQSATALKQVTLHNTSTATSTPATTQTQQGTAVKSTSADSTAQATTTQGTATPTTDSKTATQTTTKAATTDSSKTAAPAATDTKVAAQTAAKTDAMQTPTTDSSKTADASAQQSATDTKTDASAKSADIQKTDLGSTDTQLIDAVKTAAAAEFAKTGKAQEITALDPAESGSTDTSEFNLDNQFGIPQAVYDKTDPTKVDTPAKGSVTYDQATNTLTINLANDYELTQSQVAAIKQFAGWSGTGSNTTAPMTITGQSFFISNSKDGLGNRISISSDPLVYNHIDMENIGGDFPDGDNGNAFGLFLTSSVRIGTDNQAYPDTEVWVALPKPNEHFYVAISDPNKPLTDADKSTATMTGQVSATTAPLYGNNTGRESVYTYHFTDAQRDMLLNMLADAKTNGKTVGFTDDSTTGITGHQVTWNSLLAQNTTSANVQVSIVNQNNQTVYSQEGTGNVTYTSQAPYDKTLTAETADIPSIDVSQALNALLSGQSYSYTVPDPDDATKTITKTINAAKTTYTWANPNKQPIIGFPSAGNPEAADPNKLITPSVYDEGVGGQPASIDIAKDSSGAATGVVTAKINYKLDKATDTVDVTFQLNDPTLNAGEVSYVDVTDSGKTSGFTPDDIKKDSSTGKTNVLTTDPVPIGNVDDPITYTDEPTVLAKYPDYFVVQENLPSGKFTQDQLDHKSANGYVYLVKKTAFDTTDPSDAEHQSTRSFTFTGDGSTGLKLDNQTLYWVKQTTNKATTDASGKVTGITPSSTWLAFASEDNAKTYVTDMSDTNPDNDTDAAKLLAAGYGDSGTFAIPENHQATANNGATLSASKAGATPVDATVGASDVTVDGSVDVKDIASKANQTVTITLSATKSAGAEIHYIDVSNTKKTSGFAPNDGNQVASVVLDGDTGAKISTDGAKLYDYAKDGYVAVQKADLTDKTYDATTPAEFYTYLRKANTTYTPDNPGDTDQTNHDALTKAVTEYVTYGAPVGDGTTKEELKDYDLYRTATVTYTEGKTDPTITYSPWTTNTNGDVKLDADGNVSDGTDTINVAKLTTNELQKQPGYTESFANTATGATLTDDQKAANVDVSLKIAKDANNSPIEIDRAVNYTKEKAAGTVHYVYQNVDGPEVAPDKPISGDVGDDYTSQITVPPTIKTTDGKGTDGTALDNGNGTLDTSTLYYYATADVNGGQFNALPDNIGPDSQYKTDGQDIWVIYTAKPGIDNSKVEDGTPVTVKRTIHYVKNEVQSDGNPKAVSVAPDAVQTLTLTPKVIKDEKGNVIKTVSYVVTGSSEDGKGTADTTVKKIFTSLASPTVADLTPDNAMVDDQNVPLDVEGNPEDLETTVTYTPSASAIQSLTVPDKDDQGNETGTGNTVYFYKGPKVTDLKDIPADDMIGQVIVKNGETPKLDLNVKNTDTDPKDNKTTYTIYNGTTEVGTFDAQNGEDGKAPNIYSFTVDTPATKGQDGTITQAASHTTYFYTGDKIPDPAQGTQLTQADIEKNKDTEIGHVTVDDPLIGAQDNHDGTFTLTVNGQPSGTAVAMPKGNIPAFVAGDHVDKTDTANGYTPIYIFADGDTTNTAGGNRTEVDIPDAPAGNLPDLDLQDNHDGTFELTINGVGTGTPITLPTKAPTIHSVTVNDTDKGTHTTYFYTGDVPATHTDGTAITPESPLTYEDVQNAKNPIIGDVETHDGEDGQTPQVETIPDPDDPSKNVYNFYIPGPNNSHQSIGTVEEPTPEAIHSFTVDKLGDATTGTPTQHTTYFYTGDVLKPAEGEDALTPADIPAGAKVGEVTVSDGVSPQIETIPDPDDSTKNVYSFYVTGPDGHHQSVGTIPIPKDGQTPTIQTADKYAKDGTTVIGKTITVNSFKDDGTPDVQTFVVLNPPIITHADVKDDPTNKDKVTGEEITITSYDNDGNPTKENFTIKNGTDGSSNTNGDPHIKEEGGNLILFIPAGKDADGNDVPEKDLGTVPLPGAGDTITAERVKDTDKPGIGGVKITVTHATGDPTITYLYDGENGKNAQTPSVKPGTDEKGNKVLTFFIPANGDTPEQDLGNIPAPKDGDTITTSAIDGDADHPNGGILITIKHGDGSKDTTETIWNGNDGATPVVDPKGTDNGDGTTTYQFTVNGKPTGSFTVKDGKDGADGQAVQAKTGMDINGNPVIIFFTPAHDDIPENDMVTIPQPKDGDTITATPIDGDADHPNGGTLLTIKHGDGSDDTTQTIWNGNDGASPVVDPKGIDNGDGTTTYNMTVNGQPAGSFTVKNGNDGKDGTPLSVKPGTDKDGKPTLVFYIPGPKGDGTDDTDISTLPVPNTGDTITSERVTDTDKPGVSGVKITVTHANGDPDTISYIYDGATPEITPSQDGKSFTISIGGKDVATIKNGEDGKTPEITVTPNKDDAGNVISNTLTITTPGSTDAPQTVTISNGATPTFTKTETGYDIMLNGTKVGELKDGEDGKTPTVTTKPATDENGKPIGTTLVINGQDSGTILNGPKGDTGDSPVITPELDDSGNPTGNFVIKVGDKTVGTLQNGKDGKTPEFTENKDTDGKVLGYTITIDGKTVGTITNGKDGSVVTTKPLMDGDKQIGVTLVIDGKDSGTILNGPQGEKGDKGDPGSSPVITPEVDENGQPTGNFTITVGEQTVGTLRSGKDGATPQFNPVKDNDGNVTGYDILVNNTKVGSITNGKDGATPVITQTPTTDGDGNVTGTTITITTPGSDKTQTINVTNGKDGSTPVLTPEKDDNGNIIGYAITINGNPAGELKNGKDGSVVTTKPALDKDGNQIGVTIVIDGKDGDTILNGKDGASPVITPEKDPNGNPTGTLDIVIDGKTVGTLHNGVDGKTPDFTPVKDDQGNIISYNITIDGKTVGSIKNGVDGKTPVITQTPEKDTDGKTIGTTITITTPGSDQPAQTINISNGKDGTDGKTPQVKAVPGADGKTSYVFYTIDPDGTEHDFGTIDAPKDGKSITVTDTSKDDQGNTVVTFSDGTKATIDKGADGKDAQTPRVKEVTDGDGNKTLVFYIPGQNGSDDQVVGNVPAPKDGHTPLVEPLKDDNGNVTNYQFYYTNDQGEKVSTGIVPAPKDGSTPTVKPYTGTDGKTGYTFTLNGVDYNVTNGVDGQDGEDGTDGKDLTVTGSTIDQDGNTIVTFSDGHNVKIPAGAAGKDGQTPRVKEVPNPDGTKSLVFYIPGPAGDGSDDTVLGKVDAPKDGTNGTDGKDGQTPTVKPIKDADGNTISYEFYIPGPTGDGSDDKIMGIVPAPKDGKDGAALTVKSQLINSDGNTVVTFSDGSQIIVNKGKDGTNGTDGKDAPTPQVRTVKGEDGTNAYEFYVVNPDGSTTTIGTVKAPKDGINGTNGVDGKDAQTPQVKEVTNSDGSKSYEFYITNPDGSTTDMGNVPAPKDGKDGETPTVTPHTDGEGNVDGYTFTIDGHDYTVKNGEDGKDLTIKSSTTDKDGNTVIIFSDGSTVTVDKGAKGDKGDKGDQGEPGETPQVKAVVGQDGKTSYVFYTIGEDGKEVDVGTVDAPKDGQDAQTPQVKEVTNNDGSKSYVFYITNPDGSEKTVGNVPAPKDGQDGETPTVTPYDKDGQTGFTFTIGGKDYTVLNGKDGVDGKDGLTPQMKVVKGEDGTTSYEFYVNNPDGSETPVGLITAPKDGQDGKTPSVEPITDANGNTVSYNFYYTNDKGEKVTLGMVPAPKDGQTPTVTPHTDGDGNVDGWTFTLNGKDYTVKNGQDGADGQSITVVSQAPDADGNTVVTFSDGSQVKIPNGKDGKNGQTPQVKAVENTDGTTSYEFYVLNPDGSTTTVGKVNAPKDGVDGKTPHVEAIKDGDGNIVAYNFYYTNADGDKVSVGRVDAPKNGVDGKDGQTPTVAPHYDADGNVDGWTFTLNGIDYTLKDGKDGKDGADGKDGQTPQIDPSKTVVNKEAGTTTYYFTYPDGSNAGSITVPNGGGSTTGDGTGTGNGGINITNNNINNGGGSDGQGTDSSTTSNTSTTTNTTTNPDGSKTVKTVEIIINPDGSKTTKTTTTTTPGEDGADSTTTINIVTTPADNTKPSDNNGGNTGTDGSSTNTTKTVTITNNTDGSTTTKTVIVTIVTDPSGNKTTTTTTEIVTTPGKDNTDNNGGNNSNTTTNKTVTITNGPDGSKTTETVIITTITNPDGSKSTTTTDTIEKVPGGVTPNGNTPDGNTPDGNKPGGNTPDGNVPNGNVPDGNTPTGNTPTGNNTPGGNTPTGNTPTGDNTTTTTGDNTVVPGGDNGQTTTTDGDSTGVDGDSLIGDNGTDTDNGGVVTETGYDTEGGKAAPTATTQVLSGTSNTKQASVAAKTLPQTSETNDGEAAVMLGIGASVLEAAMVYGALKRKKRHDDDEDALY
ncbi:KxYKxGKxW signal peptide domain-containing protein [Lactobacillus sp. LC28-10]|uniref:KxYKxGKxW signal peptide domain-containing protein n=1 Tax=Secundilactobacillus angelensis TaxID=2722706 RepID=A0ABX1KU72_9LACO|nr:KxYKxGKxW signal peptide domain-containing protein [Secundilactobacillus angelensis]MCH5461327.1 KxYKxGKxW signal peptide domain-containing protein [Secundilactobacillus angelensis]NLR17477.1 KxYKxGKxW signal peptide domain-containing protein [Secundilactobacillus angelensis]